MKHFLGASALDISSGDWNNWFEKLKTHELETTNSNLKIAYQKSEQGYHARSFEDAFINVNLDLIKSNKNNLQGLKNKNKLDSFTVFGK